MEEVAVQDERPDIFGPYFSGVEAIHGGILEFLRGYSPVKKETIMFPLQCTYGEYTGEHHDSNYAWKKLFFDGDRARGFAVGFNKQRLFSLEANKAPLLSRVIDAWAYAGFGRPEIEGDIPNVSALSKPDWEMILSLHFYYDRKYNDDAIDDTQYCKIVYTYSSLESKLEKILHASVST